MTKREFLNKIEHDKEDVLQQFLDLLSSLKIDYCIIGGLAVNAYVEPVVSLDLDIVITIADLERFMQSIKKDFMVERFPQSINLSSPKSDLRIQIQTDPRYQVFIKNSSIKNIMGYNMKVAALENILHGKIWAYLDKTRRASKRQKDLADIFRIIEDYPNLKSLLPESISI